ncbi:MAG: signal recognition particle subunit SRP19/SEC65 family protein [Candidatus Bathyarchaeia archaeon]
MFGVGMRKRDMVILWPVYFDISRSRREGRRLPKRFCIQSPNILMLEKIVRNLGLNYEICLEASYPRLPWIKIGFIAVSKSGKRKSQILREIASELIRLGQQSS